MKKRKLILVALSVVMSTIVWASDTTKTVVTKEVKEIKKVEPKGKAIVSVFANFNITMRNGVSKCGFQLDRTYLGYQYSLGKGLELKAVMDIGKPSSVDDYHYVAYIKNAQVSWKHKGLTLAGGMISTTQFNMQEKFWGYRYIYKSFQDQYKFGRSADLGLMVALTFMPVEGLSVRLYGGLNDATAEGKSDVYNYAAFVGYKNKRFSLGGEFAMMQNSGNIEHRNQLGCSVYGSVKAHKVVDVYARWDMLTSNNGWNVAKDEMAVIAGAQVKLGKYVKVAPNFRMTIPKDGDSKYMAYVSCYFGL